jgi:drug/metabolite transporter (DMT)-like permease
MLAPGLSAFLNRLWARPYLLLMITAVGWGGNVVASKLAVGQVSPMAVVFLRWLMVVSLLVGFSWRQVWAEREALRTRWPLLMAMGVFGFTGFNALFYIGAHHTQAVNIAIIQGAMPIVVMIVGFLAFRTPLRPLEGLGALVTIVGVLVTASRGHWETIAHFAFNRGDLLILIATVLYGLYTVMLRARPKVSPLTFLTATAFAALLSSVPLLGYEIATGAVQWPQGKAWALMAFIALFPSLISQVLYVRANEIIGPSRASLFMNIVPILGTVLSAVILGEAVLLLDIAALGLVLGGIFIAERAKR